VLVLLLQMPMKTIDIVLDGVFSIVVVLPFGDFWFPRREAIVEGGRRRST
jgi:hypothetical protein